MNNIVEIKDLNFSYGDVKVFENLNLKIESGTFTTIIGPNSSGKSTLLKLIIGTLFGDSFVHTCSLSVTKENLTDVRRNVSVVFSNPDDFFVAETVMDEIAFSLENMRYDKASIQSRVERIAYLFGITGILNENPRSLDVNAKALVSFASSLVISPKLIVIDGGFNYLDADSFSKVMKILKDLNKNDGLTIINITNNPEDILYGDRVILLDKGKVIFNTDLSTALDREDDFISARLDLPFMVSLSNKLKFYNLVHEVETDPEKLVDDLWK